MCTATGLDLGLELMWCAGAIISNALCNRNDSASTDATRALDTAEQAIAVVANAVANVYRAAQLQCLASAFSDLVNNCRSRS